MKTKTQIIKETIQYYKTHKLGLDEDGKCVYIRDDSHGTYYCAVGRVMNDRGLDEYGCYENGVASIEIELRHDDNVSTLDGIDPLLKEEYKGHSTGFWIELQELHDSSIHWRPNGEGGYELTEIGHDCVKRMLKKYDYA